MTGKMVTLNFLNETKAGVDVAGEIRRHLAVHGGALAPEDRGDLENAAGLLERGEFRLKNNEINFITRNPGRTADYILFRYRFRFYPSLKKLAGYPLHVLVEPSSVCNLRCVMCFQSDESFRAAPYAGMMSLELFKKIVDESVDNGLRALTISGRGEPLLNRNIGAMLEYASGKFFDFKINTNATVLTEKLARAILSSGVTDLVLSIDSADPQQYAKIRVGGNFETVVKNVAALRKMREEEFPGSPLRVRVSAVKVLPEQDMERYTSFWGAYADDVSYTSMIDRADTYNNLQGQRTTFCERLWHRLYIWFDGGASPCDYDYKSLLNVGNVTAAGVRAVWLGERLRQLRETHERGERGTLTPCDRCSL